MPVSGCEGLQWNHSMHTATAFEQDPLLLQAGHKASQCHSKAGQCILAREQSASRLPSAAQSKSGSVDHDKACSSSTFQAVTSNGEVQDSSSPHRDFGLFWCNGLRSAVAGEVTGKRKGSPCLQNRPVNLMYEQAMVAG